MKLEYDERADAVYIYFSDAPYSYGEDIDNERGIYYDADGELIGVELLSVSNGVITADLPYRSEIERLLGEHHIKVFA
jgi:uncharacterized protein YuzE